MAFWIFSTLFLILQKALVLGPRTPHSNQPLMCSRKLLLQQPVLISLNISALFCIKVGSLDFTTGAVPSQAFKKDGKLYSVTFLSKFLSLVKCNYEIHNNKILAIIYALKKQCHFLESLLFLCCFYHYLQLLTLVLCWSTYQGSGVAFSSHTI